MLLDIQNRKADAKWKKEHDERWREWNERHRKYHGKKFLTWWVERSAWLCWDRPECVPTKKVCAVHKRI